MSRISDRYRRHADAFTAKVRAVPPERWDDPSPCEGWTARDVVGHVAQSQSMFLGFIDRSVGEAPDVADDPLGAWTAARDAVQTALDDPEAATTTFEGFFGETSFEQGVDRFLSFDLVVHGWDLARATGLDEHIDPDEVRRLTEETMAFGDAARQPGVFGPALEPPPGSDEQTKLLALVGRRA
jgi:uncharacterized protein (TIGR03086 family)